MANWVRSFLEEHPQYKTKRVVKRARHAIHFYREDLRMAEAFFTPQPMHYQDDLGQWQPLDTALQEYPDGLGAPGIPVRISRDGQINLTDGDYSHKTTRIGVFNRATGTFTAKVVLPEGLPSEDCVIRETAKYRYEIRLLEDGIRETFTIKEPLGIGAGEEWIVLETAVTGITFPDGELGEFQVAGRLFFLPSATDANGEAAPIKRFAKKVGGTQYIYTGIPVSWFATAAYPITIDPDFAASTSYGYVYGLHATDYLAARATSFGHDLLGLYVGQYYSGTQYRSFRSYLKFDTSSIPDEATPSRVFLKLACSEDVSTTDFDVQIIKQDWSAQDPLSAANREAAYDNCLAGLQDDNIWRNTAGIVLNTIYYSGNLNISWINKTGNTYYSLRSNRDYAATQPTTHEYISFVSPGGSAPLRPVLIVVYPGGMPSFLEFSQSPGASSTTCVIPKPTNLAVGDLMIAHVNFRNSAATTLPEGWTLVNEVTNGTAIRSTIAYKIATAEDVAAASFTFTNASKVSNIGCISTYLGHDPTNPIGASNGQANAASTTITAPTITPPVANCLILWLASASAANTQSAYAIVTDNPTWTERYDVLTTAGSDTAVSMATGPRPQTTATGNGTATTSASVINAGHLVAIRPATAAAAKSDPAVFVARMRMIDRNTLLRR